MWKLEKGEEGVKGQSRRTDREEEVKTGAKKEMERRKREGIKHRKKNEDG